MQNTDLSDYMANRQALVTAGQQPHSAIDVKHMSFPEIQKYGQVKFSGVTYSTKGVSYHDVHYIVNGQSKKAFIGVDNAIIVINGVKDMAEISADKGNQKPTDFVNVQFNIEFDQNKQTDPAAWNFANALNTFDYDVHEHIKSKIARNEVGTQNTKFAGMVQRTFSYKSTAVIEVNGHQVQAAGRPLDIPIIRATMKFSKNSNSESKIPTTKVYDVRESAKNIDPATGAVKWVEATINGEKINGNNWMHYINSSCKVWMLKGTYQVNQSNMGISGGFDVWHIAIEHVPMIREATSTLNQSLISRMSALALAPAPTLPAPQEQPADPLANAIVGQVTNRPADEGNSMQSFLQQIQQPAQQMQMQMPQMQMQMPQMQQQQFAQMQPQQFAQMQQMPQLQQQQIPQLQQQFPQ